ncbi:VCBS repeat-containing protein [Polyangium sp. y55x31]|uniref:FG-GAP repeat domain-containing protein n=1 Tax=Polyangium sp. y55x31 TaxID=3042688 RepID=UPI0024825445|nr:VCBS repeat-containing protein [Polyangium sp. y55x31]MDI1475249.1 VCBS repeat-containing protein [Polyangium sp. y55x31]
MRRRLVQNRWLAAAGVFALALSALAEGCGDGTVTGSGGSGGGGSGPGGQGGDGGTFTVGAAQGGGFPGTCDPTCEPTTQVCSHGVCVPVTGCTNDADCKNDTYCEPMLKQCVPWESASPPNDPTCINVIAAGQFSPRVKCEFSAAPDGDPFPGHVDVQGTPIVTNFNKPAAAGSPSIVAAFTPTVIANYTEDQGVIRVLSGKDCSLEANLGGTDVDGDGTPDWIVSSSTLASGDLDGDGVAEIVAYGADGSTLAFTKKAGTWGLLWKSPYQAGIPGGPCDFNQHRCPVGWAGPSIHDLDDDGKPEVLREGAVLRADGSLASGAPPLYSSYSAGLFSVVANLDQDPNVEFTNGHFIWEWTGGAWVNEPYFPGVSSTAPGHVAIADFGAYGGAGVPAKNPEIVVVRNNLVMIYAIDGTPVQIPVAVPGNGGGGPPTISDFDGDGLPEVAVAGQAYYTIYDLDCGPSPRPGGQCNLGPCDYAGGTCPAGQFVLWSRSTQDLSSNVTGSSVFDFEADGSSEVVYGDECFVRVYDGDTGDVLFSQYRSSCTWYENPIIADVDGNFRADLVTPSNKACSPDGTGIPCQTLDANGVDPQFPGVRCQNAADCVSGVCDAGFCRCSETKQCCAAQDDAACIEEGLRCAPPPVGTPGNGNTCRAGHPHGVSGIRVYSDANDKWVRSRTIWNQHPYAVTHVNEDGTIPKTSAWTNNWDDPKLNNFRQNVPGNANGAATGDPTAGASTQFACSGQGVEIGAPICNRGADPVGAGLSVGFYVGQAKVCEAKTTEVLPPGECRLVSCNWGMPPTIEAEKVDVTVIPNDDGAYAECKPGNNLGTIVGVFCKPPA